MKKKMLILWICFIGMVASINAQSCDCLPLLEEMIIKVEKEIQINSKNISIEKLEYLRWLDNFKALAKRPHSKEDCQNLITDYLSLLEDDFIMKQFEFKKGKII